MNESDYAANDGNGLMAMLLAGLGVGQHFKRCVQPHLDSGELVPVLTEWNRSGMPFHILYPPNRVLVKSERTHFQAAAASSISLGVW